MEGSNMEASRWWRHAF